ncbi:MAG: 2-C-methyl-D-erythritol 2,4-cyclodiphosphate synthase [Fimbriimonadaceae bacterium]|nr:2-C-methyl-D-erythritol 2,4-cyclodiphosphate synthase [Fimbriimonadaceae bacterium]
MVVALVVAAGRSERFGRDKLDLPLGGRPVWRWSVDAFLGHPLVDFVYLVGPEKRALGALAGRTGGGESRQESVRNGLKMLQGGEVPDEAVVLIHDAARPFIDATTISEVIEACGRSRAAAVALPVVDTIRHAEMQMVVDRTHLLAMQTPQAGRLSDLLMAHQSGPPDQTDDIALLEAVGIGYELVSGDRRNFKVTTEEDYTMAQAMVERPQQREIRTGLGYDVHAFSTDAKRPLFLGGVEFAGPGLEGHSDADALLHAVVDALLGAASLGDIGVHFPPSDPQWKDRSSLHFLSEARRMIEDQGWAIGNVDATVLAEHPKIMGRREEICGSIASALGIEQNRVSIKATTHERLGSIGRGEGIAAMAIATVSRPLRGDE